MRCDWRVPRCAWAYYATSFAHFVNLGSGHCCGEFRLRRAVLHGEEVLRPAHLRAVCDTGVVQFSLRWNVARCPWTCYLPKEVMRSTRKHLSSVQKVSWLGRRCSTRCSTSCCKRPTIYRIFHTATSPCELHEYSEKPVVLYKACRSAISVALLTLSSTISSAFFLRPPHSPMGWQQKISDMSVKLDAARLLTWKAAAARDAGENYTKEAAMAKLFASEAATFCSHAVSHTNNLVRSIFPMKMKNVASGCQP